MISPKKASNESVPIKLLNELASLSNQKFQIDLKSKYQHLTLPLTRKALKKSHLKSLDNQEAMEHSDEDFKDKRLTTDSDEDTESSALENDYVILKCNIVNRSLTLVPPIRIFVPYNYPDENPFVDCVQLDEFGDDMLPEYSKTYYKLIFKRSRTYELGVCFKFFGTIWVWVFIKSLANFEKVDLK